MACTWSSITAAPTTGVSTKIRLLISARKVQFSVIEGNNVFLLSECRSEQLNVAVLQGTGNYSVDLPYLFAIFCYLLGYHLFIITLTQQAVSPWWRYDMPSHFGPFRWLCDTNGSGKLFNRAERKSRIMIIMNTVIVLWFLAIAVINSAFHPFGVDRWVVSCNWMSPTLVRGGAIWWMRRKERQAWCNLQVKLCDPCLSALRYT